MAQLLTSNFATDFGIDYRPFALRAFAAFDDDFLSIDEPRTARRHFRLWATLVLERNIPCP
ncbi:MAG: hypothetical protein ACO1OX_06845 [Novosphingobium sp.]